MASTSRDWGWGGSPRAAGCTLLQGAPPAPVLLLPLLQPNPSCQDTPPGPLQPHPPPHYKQWVQAGSHAFCHTFPCHPCPQDPLYHREPSQIHRKSRVIICYYLSGARRQRNRVLQCAIILLYDGIVQPFAFKAIQGRAAQPEPFCPSMEPDGASPEQSPGRVVWFPWPFHAAGSRDMARPRYLPMMGLRRCGTMMLCLPGDGGGGDGTSGPF